MFILNKKLLLQDLSDLLEVSVVLLTDKYRLASNSLWDSLAFVSTLALIDEHYHISINARALEKCIFLSDIFKLVENKMREDVKINNKIKLKKYN